LTDQLRCLVLGLWFEAWHRDKTVNAGRQPGAQACTGDTHLFAFMDLPRGRGRERRRGRERLGKRRAGTKLHDWGYRPSQSDRSNSGSNL